MTTHLLVALYKDRRGGRERRANCYWQGTLEEQGEAHAACWLEQHLMRSFTTKPTCRQRPRLRSVTIPRRIPLLGLRIPHGTSGLVRQQVAMPTDDTQPPQPRPERDTPTQRTCSSIRRTGPNQTEWSGTHWECESGRDRAAAGSSCETLQYISKPSRADGFCSKLHRHYKH